MGRSILRLLFILSGRRMSESSSSVRKWAVNSSRFPLESTTIVLLLSLTFVCICFSPGPLLAGTITAVSCSQADVASAVSSASNGDTVLVPPGTCTWNTPLTVTKGITMIGAGMGTTILTDNVSKGDLNCQGGSPMMVWSVNSPSTFRFSGFTINGQVITSTAQGACGGTTHISFSGTARGFRVDHVSFTNMQTGGLSATGALVGLIDHVTCTYNFKQCFVIQHNAWNGNSYGDGSWSQPITWGSSEMIYIEDSVCTNTNVNGTSCTDGYDGARFVFRHNTVNGDFIGFHGTDSHGRGRSVRQVEIYNNTIKFNDTQSPARFAWIRGGSAVVFNNTVTSVGVPAQAIQTSNCRDPNVNCGNNPSGSWSPWGACNGSSPYDLNATVDNGIAGYMCIDQPGAGTSRLLSGNPPTGGSALSVSEPMYFWGNTWNGVQYNKSGGSPHVIQNRDFFTNNTNTPKPGYTPFPYPHPLQTAGGTGAPAPPTGLTVQ